MPKTVTQYLADFTFALETHFHLLPGDNLGEPGDSYRLVADYVARNDKRAVVLYIQRGSREITRIVYTLPVGAAHASLFNKTGVQPSSSPAFTTVRMSVEDDARTCVIKDSANVLALWPSEIERVSGLSRTLGDGAVKTAATQLSVYWAIMRLSLLTAVKAAGITLLTSMNLTPNSNSSSNSSVHSYNIARASRRRSSASNNPARRPGSYKSNSDPAHDPNVVSPKSKRKNTKNTRITRRRQ
jgi:hypothetical protein